jgi:hypothetical protein
MSYLARVFENESETITIKNPMVFTGGVSISGAAVTAGANVFAGVQQISDATDTTSGGTGSLFTAGGVGITKALYVGTTIKSGGAVLPATSDVAALGSGSLMWSDLFLASGAVINFNNSNLLITHSAGILTMGGVLLVNAANATNNTVVRGLFTTMTASGTAMTTSYSAAAIRGLTNLTGTTVGNAYFYGVQGKLAIAGTLDTGSQIWAAALVSQLDLSGAATYTANEGAVASLWVDCGASAHANAITAAPTFVDVVAITNSIATFKPHSLIRMQGDATYAFALSNWDVTSQAVDWIVTGGDTTAAAPKSLKVRCGASTYYIRMHSAA